MGKFRTPFSAAQTSAPMFGGSAEPAYPNPLQGMPGMDQAGPALQMFLPVLLQQLGAKYGMVPNQYQPTQNMFDQMQAAQYHQQQAVSMQSGQRHDQAQIQQVIQGAMRTMQKDPLSRQQQQQAATMAGQVQQYLPMLAAVVGPEMADSLFGSTGSATLLSQSIHRGMRSTRDPVTGAGRTSGASAGFISDEIFQRMHGVGAAPGASGGLSAGQAGELFESLQARGLLSLGGSAQERLGDIAKMDFDKAQQRRMAEAELRASGREVDEKSLRQMQETMFEGPGSTLGRMQGGGDDARALQGLEGADTLLRAGDADRIAKQLKNMSGAVGAMRDIFGDMGDPNAPMAALIEGLDALTSGRFANMTPGEMEQTVRTTRNLAKASGLGMEAMGILGEQITRQTQGLGGSTAAVPFLLQQTAAGSVGFDRAGMGRIKGEGALNRQEATLLEARLGAGAAASQQANAQFAILRMERELGGQIPKDSKLAAMAAAIREGRDTVTYKDQATGKMVTEKIADMELSNGDVAEMAKQSGINPDVARSYIADRTGNADEINTAGGKNAITNARARQLRSDLLPVLSQAYASPLFSMINDETAIGKAMKGAGVSFGHEDNMALGHAMAEGAMTMDAATRADPEKQKLARRAIARKAIEDRMRQQLRAQGVPADEIEKRIQQVRGQLTDDVLDQMTAAQKNLSNAAIARSNGGRFAGLKGEEGAFQILSPEAQAARGKAQFEQENEARIQSSFGNIGREHPLARVIDAVKAAKPGEDIGRMAAKALGFVDEKEINEVLDKGPLRALRDLQEMQGDTTTITGEAMRNDKGELTEAGRKHQELTAEFAEGMNQGGKESDEALQKAADAFGVKDAAALSKLVEGKLADPKLDPKERKRMERLKRMITVTQGAKGGDTIVSQLGKLKAEQKAEADKASEGVSPDAVTKTDGAADAGKAGDFNKKVTEDEKKKAGSDKMALSGTLTLVGLDKVLMAGSGVTGDHENNGVQTHLIAPNNQSTG